MYSGRRPYPPLSCSGGKEQRRGDVLKLEGLNREPIGHIVLDSIHLYDAGVGVFSDVFLVFLEGASFQKTAIFTLIILYCFLLGKLAAQLSAQGECINTKCL